MTAVQAILARDILVQAPRCISRRFLILVVLIIVIRVSIRYMIPLHTLVLSVHRVFIGDVCIRAEEPIA